MRHLMVLVLGVFLYSTTVAQNTFEKKKVNVPPPPIQDNSFLIEEAYNQDAGVVQHINTFMRMRNGDWLFTFTQEWPVRSYKHQLSLTMPAQRFKESGSGTGVGDTAINYRYQLVGNSDAKLLIAPRVSLLVPTGDSSRGMGMGGVGWPFNLPVTAFLHEKLVTHWNAGTTLTPNAKNATGDKAGLKGFNLGQSFGWLVRRDLNLMFETAWNRNETVAGPGLKERADSMFLNPGVRWAHNFKSGLQIVPGVAVPIGVGPSNGTRGLFVYLSIEHAFRKF